MLYLRIGSDDSTALHDLKKHKSPSFPSKHPTKTFTGEALKTKWQFRPQPDIRILGINFNHPC